MADRSDDPPLSGSPLDQVDHRRVASHVIGRVSARNHHGVKLFSPDVAGGRV
jgi:hypothetical protein